MSEAAKTSRQPSGRPADWKEIHQRLESFGSAMERTQTPEERQAILKDRARRLAQAPDFRNEEEKGIEIVEFLLGGERYGIRSASVREVLPLKELTPLPGTPGFVLGIINVHGQIHSVIDIRKFFELPAQGLTDLNKVLILHSETMAFGILADAVLGVRRIPPGDIKPSLPTLTGIRERYLQGVTPERLVVLNAEKLLNDKKLVVQEDTDNDLRQ